LIGELALAGLPLLARVEAYKAGHALHTQLVSRLLADRSLWSITTGETAPVERQVRLTRLSPAPATD
jgi:UDP-3-O-[3-hydroxymyristoyl] N-acetylglucosamine deacetylase